MIVKVVLAVLLGCVVQESLGEESFTVVQDWLTLRSQPQRVPPVRVDYTSRDGFIRNPITNRNIKPEHAPTHPCPRKDLWVKMANTNNEESYKFRWIQAEGHLG